LGRLSRGKGDLPNKQRKGKSKAKKGDKREKERFHTSRKIAKNAAA